MEFITIKTRAFIPPKDNLFNLIDEYLTDIKENDILVITSKILAIHQGRCIKIDSSINKKELIFSEADAYITTSHIPKHEFTLTIKDHTLIASAGIDESNADGYYILWPKNIIESLIEVHKYITEKYKIKNLGIITTDSHCVPMRRGVTGISIGFYGFDPLYDYVGKKDIFGRELKFTKTNIVDAISAMAVMIMGEGSESTPMLIARDIPLIKFNNEDKSKELFMEPKEDMFFPILDIFKRP